MENNKATATQVDQSNTQGDHASVIYGTHFPNRLFVGCLPPQATADDLGKYFGDFGKVVEAKVVLDEQRRSKRFGFVSFAKEEEADAVLKHGPIYLLGKRINVGPAVKKEVKDTVAQVPVKIVTSKPVCSSGPDSEKPRKEKYTYTINQDGSDAAPRTVGVQPPRFVRRNKGRNSFKKSSRHNYQPTTMMTPPASPERGTEVAVNLGEMKQGSPAASKTATSSSVLDSPPMTPVKSRNVTSYVPPRQLHAPARTNSGLLTTQQATQPATYLYLPWTTSVTQPPTMAFSQLNIDTTAQTTYVPQSTYAGQSTYAYSQPTYSQQTYSCPPAKQMYSQHGYDSVPYTYAPSTYIQQPQSTYSKAQYTYQQPSSTYTQPTYSYQQPSATYPQLPYHVAATCTQAPSLPYVFLPQVPQYVY